MNSQLNTLLNTNAMKSFVLFPLFFVALLIAQPLSAQDYLPLLKIDINVDGTNLRNPMVGGLNAPQLCEADLNNDGIQDLFIFDRTGDVVLTYLNDGTNEVTDYRYDPYYIRNFPDSLAHWVLLRDFNNDGAMDIFAYSHVPGIDGVQVYEGYYQANELQFKRFNFYNNSNDLIYFDLATGGVTQLYVSTEDYPEVTDIDYDGDLDFITFGNGGGYIFLYENQSVEQGFGNDSLIFELKSTCLGGGYESGLTGCFDLVATPDSCATGLVGNADDRHAGSTILMFDEDNDQDKEIWLGDVNTPTVNRLYNGGNNQFAWWSDQDCTYPSYDTPAEVFNFPATFHLDVDNDGLKDFIVTPNADKNSEDDQNVWFYKNMTSNENPVFDYQKNTFLVEDMVDLGSGSRPVFVDYNADGLMDLIVGNESYWVFGGAKDARLFLFENIGTSSTPAYELVDDDYLGMSQFSGSNWAFAPTAGDMDNDGDIDLLIGEEFGALFYLENTAGPNQTFAFANPVFNYMNIDVGLASTPALVDLNRDGLMDIVVGERNGFLNYFQNQGTTGNPQFEADEDLAPNNSYLGEVDTRGFQSVEGYASPFFIDFDGSYMLFCGSNERGIMRYTGVEGNLTGAYNLAEDFYGNVRPGLKAHVAIAEITGDENLEMMVGNRRGGFACYGTTFQTDGSAPTNDFELSIDIDLSPNPTSEILKVKINANGQLGNSLLMTCYNSIGQVQFNKTCTRSRETIDVSALAAGIYFLEVGNGQQTVVKRFVKRN